MTSSVASLSAEVGRLPAWSSVLAVVAHPEDEAMALGAVLDAFAGAGARVSALCLTPGEPSRLEGVAGDLSVLRRLELMTASDVLGSEPATVCDYPYGALSATDPARLEASVAELVEATRPDGLVVFDADGVTGHPDHVAATACALRVAEDRDLPVLAWTLPRTVARVLNEEFGGGFTGRDGSGIDIELPVDRDRQRIASIAFADRALPAAMLWRRIELLGDMESLCWLRHARSEAVSPWSGSPAPAPRERFVRDPARRDPARRDPARRDRGGGDRVDRGPAGREGGRRGPAGPQQAGSVRAERGPSGPLVPAQRRSTEQVDPPPEPRALTVDHRSGDRYAVEVGGHRFDVTVSPGPAGHGEAPTASDLVVAGLAACLAVSARRYLVRHGLDATGLRVAASYTPACGPVDASDVSLRITAPPGLPAPDADRLLAVANRWARQSSLTAGRDITLGLPDTGC